MDVTTNPTATTATSVPKPFRQTKIVASLGPAIDDPEVMKNAIREGMDVARINFSHGNAGEHRRRVKLLRTTAESCGRAVGVLADLQGPKIRVRGFQNGPVQLTEDHAFALDMELGKKDGTVEAVGVTYQELIDDVKDGDNLLLDDGNIVLSVDSISGNKINTRVIVGGILSDNKGINLAGGGLSAPALPEKDYADIRLAGELQTDYLGLSFVRNAEDVHAARKLFHDSGGQGGIIAKIERVEALDNIEEIIRAADAIMIARGDLGVEIGNAELPGVQKRIIHQAHLNNGVVIVATQMMQSMVRSPQPTRAEVLDVANAVLDGTDAVMLSAETATGKHPAKVIAAMNHICRGAERHRSGTELRHTRISEQFASTEQTIAMATMFTANHFDVAAIVALTESGSTARWMSRINTGIPIYAITRHTATQRRVTLYQGVYPINYNVDATEDHLIDKQVVTELLRRKLVRRGERIAVTKGDHTGVAGGTNTMKIVRVP